MWRHACSQGGSTSSQRLCSTTWCAARWLQPCAIAADRWGPDAASIPAGPLLVPVDCQYVTHSHPLAPSGGTCPCSRTEVPRGTTLLLAHRWTLVVSKVPALAAAMDELMVLQLCQANSCILSRRCDPQP
jgi:hypothetical protein